MNFVKKFTLESAPKKAMAQIAVDSKYWLYINGEMAVFEGGVKRGPSRNSTYYDLGDWYIKGVKVSRKRKPLYGEVCT